MGFGRAIAGAAGRVGRAVGIDLAAGPLARAVSEGTETAALALRGRAHPEVSSFMEDLAGAVRRLKPQANVPGVAMSVHAPRGSRLGRFGGNG